MVQHMLASLDFFFKRTVILSQQSAFKYECEVMSELMHPNIVSCG